MKSTQIVPDPTRPLILGAIDLAERLTSHAAATRDDGLIAAAVAAQRAAWLALEQYDLDQRLAKHGIHPRR